MSTLEGLFSLEQADGDNNLYRIDNSGYLANEEFNCMSFIRSRIRGLKKNKSKISTAYFFVLCKNSMPVSSIYRTDTVIYTK
jgi:hypothetical protein